MKFRNIVGLLIILISCSCVQGQSNSNQKTPKKEKQQLNWFSGLHIDNGPNLGIFYTDSQGTEHSHAHKVISITNDSTLAINLELSFPKEYNFPLPDDDHKFKVILWPPELLPDYKTNSILSDELINYLECETDSTYVLNISIEPNEKYVFTIGILQLKMSNYYVSPNAVFVHKDGGLFGNCESIMNQNKSKDDSIVLALRLDIPNVGCFIIDCGQISYSRY